MATYTQVLLYSLAGGVVSLLGGMLLLSKQKFADRMAQYALPFSAGALLSAVFLDLLKDGLEEAAVMTVMLSTQIGIMVFFFAERFLRWFHHHHQHEGKDPAVSLIVVGDTVHNALDGVAIAAAFLVSVPTGIVTTIAVAAHEIPHEIGNFGLLLAKGMSRAKVLLVNLGGALAMVIVALATFALGSDNQIPLGVLIGLSAGFLLYIATSDIIPEIHEQSANHKLFGIQPFLMILGAVVVAASIEAAHHVVDSAG
jgi:zinc and cadmium transporter